MTEYDLAVIGAGSGGLVAALTAHRRGARVAMIERAKIGGECTHSGCIPSKTFINAAKVYHGRKDTASLGLPALCASTGLDFAEVMGYVDSVVQGIYEHEKPQVFQDMGIDVLVHPSGAKFLSDREIRIGDDVITAGHTVIATGSSPRMIEIMGHRHSDILNNENFWNTKTQPKSVLFLGGGVISAELGLAMALFGCEVTIVDRNPHILKVVDEEVRNVAIGILKREGIRIHTDSHITLCELRGMART